MATVRHPPFKQGKEDAGFRDAVIMLSVVDDLVSAKNHVGALVSRDDAFHDPKIIEFAADSGVKLQVFRSVKEAFDSLIKDAAEYVKTNWDATTKHVQDRLKSQLADIEKFIVETLDIPEWGLVRGARVLEVPRIEALDVRDVRVPNPFDVRGAERVRLSFDVDVKFHVKAQRFEPPPTRRLKVGPPKTLEELLESLGPVEFSASWQPSIFAQPSDDSEAAGVVRVEASADPKYQTFAFESASLVVEGLGGLAIGL